MHWVKQMPTCICARRMFGQVRLSFDEFILYHMLQNLLICGTLFGHILRDKKSIWFTRREKIVNLFAVLAEGPGWGCVSDYDEDIMDACSNTTLPANTTDISNVDSCRYVTVDHFKLQRDRICSCYIYNFIRQMAAVHATLQPVGL